MGDGPQRVLVTGGTGGLGRELVPRLAAAGHAVRVMSRRTAPAGATGEWARADLVTGDGLDEAVRGVDVVVHAASNALQDTRATDVDGTRRLAEACKRAGVANLLYVSIVGVDRIGHPYYRAKWDAERALARGENCCPDRAVGKITWAAWLAANAR
jgi:uncharacterized protein YbjT (DUF2867 family)